MPAAGVGALVSVPAAALVFTLLFAIGGTAPVDPDTVLGAMLGWHIVIGIGEAVVTGLVVGERRRHPTRPRVRGARPALETRELEIRGAPPDEAAHLPRAWACWSACCSPAWRSYYASAHPDGLEYVAEQTGFIDTAEDSADRRQPVGRLLRPGASTTTGSAAAIAGVVGVV